MINGRADWNNSGVDGIGVKNGKRRRGSVVRNTFFNDIHNKNWFQILDNTKISFQQKELRDPSGSHLNDLALTLVIFTGPIEPPKPFPSPKRFLHMLGST